MLGSPDIERERNGLAVHSQLLLQMISTVNKFAFNPIIEGVGGLDGQISLDGLENSLEGRMFDNREGLARSDNPLDERLLRVHQQIDPGLEQRYLQAAPLILPLSDVSTEGASTSLTSIHDVPSLLMTNCIACR